MNSTKSIKRKRSRETSSKKPSFADFALGYRRFKALKVQLAPDQTCHLVALPDELQQLADALRANLERNVQDIAQRAADDLAYAEM